MKDLLEAIELLDAHPPCFEPSPERAAAFRSLGRFWKTQTRVGAPFDLAGAGASIWPIVAQRLQRALAAAQETELQRDEVRLWQMYNHGVLIKSDEITMAFDVISMPRRFGWPESVEWRGNIARTVDVLFITHRHPDHFDRLLVADCLKLGRPVILPAPLADEYGYDPNLYPVNEGDRLELYDLKIRARRALHVWRDSFDDVPLAVYDVTCQSGYRLVFGGDVDYTAPIGAAPWRGRPDVFFVPWRSPNARFEPNHPESQGRPGDALRMLQETLRPKALIFEHYAELEHVYDGFEPSYELALALQAEVGVPSELLFWGESAPLNPFPFARK
jgi:L-ascorbate metabolism protein UlaG (beta-lactamase superfamily)